MSSPGSTLLNRGNLHNILDLIEFTGIDQTVVTNEGNITSNLIN